MTISDKGIALIKEFEGCKLTAYQDIVGVWTIGYGITDSDIDITGAKIKSGLTITQKTADEWLKKSLEKIYVPRVQRYQDQYRFNQNQFDALVSYAYNIGSIDGFVDAKTVGGKKVGQRTIAEISADFPNHDRVKNKDGTYRHVKGLTDRRNKEKKLFDTPIYGVGWSHDNKGWWYSPDGKNYLFSTWATIKGHRYYFDIDGYAVKDWQKIDGKWYYFEPYGESQCALYVSDKDGAQHVGEFDE